MSRQYTSEELQKIERLLKQGLKPKDIAERLGRTIQSIYQATHHYIKPGKTEQRRQEERNAERRERVVKGFEAGLTITELARAFGVTTPAICLMLDRVGLDKEERNLIRKEKIQ